MQIIISTKKVFKYHVGRIIDMSILIYSSKIIIFSSDDTINYW